MFIFTVQVFMLHLNKKTLFWLGVIVALVYCYFEARGLGDLYIYMEAAGQLNNKANIYELKYVDGYNYFYSVLFAVFLKLFYTSSFFWVKFYWLLLNVFLFFKMFSLLSSSAMINALSKNQKQIFLSLVFIFSLRFLHDNLHSSQISIFILWCCVYGIWFIHNDKPITGAAILALGINIKLLPIVFLPYLLYRGYFKAFLFTVLFYLLSLFAPSFIIGHSYNMHLLKSWLSLVNPIQARHVLDVEERSFHGLSTLLSTLLVKDIPDIYALPLKRNIADVPLEVLSKILLLVRLCLVALTLYFLNSKPFVKAKSQMQTLCEESYILLLIPLIFPHQQHYAFIFIVPAFALVLYWFLFNIKSLTLPNRLLLISLMVWIYLSGNLKMIVGTFNEYYEHYKILSYGALMLIPLLIWVFRKCQKQLL